MAAVIGDFPTATLPFPDVVSTAQHSHEPQYHSIRCNSPSPRLRRADNSRHPRDTETTGTHNTGRDSRGVARFPSPPSSSSESLVGVRSSHYGKAPTVMAPEAHQSVVVEPSAPHGDDAQSASFVGNSIPSPDSEGHSAEPVLPPRHPSQGLTAKPVPTCQTIPVRDLKHIQDLAKNRDMGNGPGILNEPTLQSMKYDISAMPIHDIIEMVAALLTKITTTNDLQHDAMSRNATHQQHASSHNQGHREMSPFSSSVLAFHGKNIPAITILNYLARIHKYCPTTYEVFLSLLVYFDRMTERVNETVMKAERERQERELQSYGAATPSKEDSDIVMQEPSDDELVDDEEPSVAGTSAAKPTASGPAPATYFVVDSFNIHRLIIAGVTCASKFFSDIFYTNSRYAKVGGLPLNELNHLELQFLILNDFRLSVAVEDLEAYATMLVEFYAREVVSKKSRRLVSAT